MAITVGKEHEDEYVRRYGGRDKTKDDPLGQGPEALVGALAREIVGRMPQFDSVRDAVYAIRTEWNRLHVEAAEARVAADAKRIADAVPTHTYRGVPVNEEQFRAFAKRDGYEWPKGY